MGNQIKLNAQSLSKPGKRWVLALSVIGLLVTGTTAVYNLNASKEQSSEALPLASITPVTEAVSSLGRIEPRGEVITLSPPPTQGGAKVTKLLVREGDWVKAEQVVAILDNYDRKQAAVELAQKEVKVAQANLAIVKAGAKKGEINAQRATIRRLYAQLQTEKKAQLATIERLKAELANAEIEFRRNQQLAREGAISASELDGRRLTLDTARERVEEAEANLSRVVDTLTEQIQEAKANLDRIAEVRDVDVYKAQAEVERASASLKQAQADLELAYVRAPINGQILKINTRAGEKVPQEEGIVELGQTDQMMVVAEIYESDIGKVRLGQKAAITSEGGAFTGQLKGSVSEIGLKIGKRDVLDTDPAADVDVRVVEVKILLDPESSRRVSSLTYAKVVVKISNK